MKKKDTLLIRIFTVIMLLTVGTGCQDELLNPVPESVLTTANAFNTAQDIDLAVLGVYSSLQTKVQKDYLIMEMTSDNMFAEYYATEPGLIEMEFLTVSSENNILNVFWKNAYSGISRANSVLTYIDRPTNYAAGKKDQYIGEAKFMRALFYFDLVRIFGDVPLVLKQLSAVEAEQVGRTPSADIYAQILDDLNDAVAKLPNPSSMPRGRASKAAALTLLSRVYIQMKDWPNAKTRLEQVVNGFNYKLVTNFRDLFSLETEANTEAIYSVPFVAGTNGQELSTTFAPLQGVLGIVSTGNRVGRPSWDLHKRYDPKDTRKKVTIEEWQLPANATSTSQPIWYPYINKYMVPHLPNTSGLDIPIMRYAEVILMYAEALYETGNTAGALEQINIIRKRAFKDDLHNYTPDAIATRETFLDVLLLERRLELAFENHRWFDLVRTDRFTKVLKQFEGEYNPGTGTAEIQEVNAKEFMRYFPIPYEQIQLAKAGVLKQNDGY